MGWFIVQIVLIVMSTAYQVVQAKKARKKAKAAAEARKGFEIPVEGEGGYLPIVYGRAKIGGYRVFHETKKSYKFPESIAADNVDRYFSTGYGFVNSGDSTGSFNLEAPALRPDGIVSYTRAYLPDDLYLNPLLGSFPEYEFGTIYLPDFYGNTRAYKFFEITPQLRGMVWTLGTTKSATASGLWITGMSTVTFEVTITDKSLMVERGIEFYELTIVRYNIATPISDGNVLTYSGGEKITAKTITGDLTKNIESDHNNFLFFQQALCLGPINNARELILEESLKLSEPRFNNSKDAEAALLVTVNYNGKVGKVDNIMAANCGARSTAYFKDMAYLSCFVKLNRDNPQFNDVPQLQLLIEGKLVRKIIKVGEAYTLNQVYEYSNNPALCLLDYLLLNVGKKLTPTNVDLESFYKAALVCDEPVGPLPTDIGGTYKYYMAGSFWYPSIVQPAIPSRILPRFECNLTIDPQKEIRENIEELLSTMGNARLRWSDGKYKLSLQAPKTNADIEIAGIITDADLVMGADINVSWPTVENKYNFCTVKFNNEFELFKEDSVSWPTKSSEIRKILRGGGTLSRSLTDDEHVSQNGIWVGVDSTISITKYIQLKRSTTECRIVVNGTKLTTATVTLSDSAGNLLQTVDENGNTIIPIIIEPEPLSIVYDANGNVIQPSNSLVNSTKNLPVNSTLYVSQLDDPDDIYIITISATASDPTKQPGISVSIESDNTILWNTSSPVFTTATTVTSSNAVYQAMLAEDNGMELEEETFEAGITDPYHALAKAEEIVRTSRMATVFEFTTFVKDKLYEPGDYVKLEISEIGVAQELYAIIDSVEMTPEFHCNIKATRFDASMLAWNVADDVYSKTIPVFTSSVVPVPSDLSFTRSYVSDTNETTRARFSWNRLKIPPSGTFEILGFSPEIHEYDSFGWPIFVKIGTTAMEYYDVPLDQGISTIILGVRHRDKNGNVSTTAWLNDKSSVFIQPLAPPEMLLTVTTSDSSFVKNSSGQVLPVEVVITASLSYSGGVATYEWYENAVLLANTPTLTVPSFNDSPSKIFTVVAEAYGQTFTQDVELLYVDNPMISIGVGNLRVANSTDGLTFHERYCELTWDNTSNSDNWLAFYQLTFTNSDDLVLGTVETLQNNFLLTFEMNQTLISGPRRTFNVTVEAVTTEGVHGAPVTITPINPQALPVTGLTGDSVFGTLFIDWDMSPEAGLDGYLIELNNGLTTSVQGASATAVHFEKVISDGVYDVRIAAYDVFGQDSLNWTAPVQIIVKSVISTTSLIDFRKGMSGTYNVPIAEEAFFSSNGTSLSWSEHLIWWLGVPYTVLAGVTAGKYIYWEAGATSYLSLTDTEENKLFFDNMAKSTSKWQIATHYPLNSSYELAWLSQANMVVGTAMIGEAAVENANIGNIIESNNFSFVENVRGSGWRLDKNGDLIVSSIKVVNDQGQIVMMSSGLSSGGVTYTPEDLINNVTITGTQVFKFSAGSSIPDNPVITLWADLRGSLSTYNWQYLNTVTSVWTNLPGVNNLEMYELSYSDAYDVTRIRCFSEGFFDETTVVKLYSGVDGISALNVLLSNLSHTIPCDSTGTALTTERSGTKVTVYEGATMLSFTEEAGTYPVVPGTWNIELIPLEITRGSVESDGIGSATVTDIIDITAGKTVLKGFISYVVYVRRLDGTTVSQMVTQTFTKSLDGYTPVKDVDYFDGVSGTEVDIQYSADNSSWHNVYVSTDKWIRTGTRIAGSGHAWVYTEGAKYIPEKGVEYNDGINGTSSYLHIKYSDDGTTFTIDNGETVGSWIGVLSNNTATDSTTFSDYTWKKVEGATGAPGAPGATGAPGAPGATGATGVSVSSITAYFKKSYLSTGIYNYTAGFTTAIQTVDYQNKYLWSYEYILYSDGSTEKTLARIIGTYTRGSAMLTYSANLTTISYNGVSSAEAASYWHFAAPNELDTEIAGDILSITNTNSDTGWTAMYTFNGTTWGYSTKFVINGNAVVTGSLAVGGGQVVGGTIATSNLKGGSKTSEQNITDYGFFFNGSTGKFCIGKDANNYMKYDGSTFLVKGDVEASSVKSYTSIVSPNITGGAISASTITSSNIIVGNTAADHVILSNTDGQATFKIGTTTIATIGKSTTRSDNTMITGFGGNAIGVAGDTTTSIGVLGESSKVGATGIGVKAIARSNYAGYFVSIYSKAALYAIGGSGVDLTCGIGVINMNVYSQNRKLPKYRETGSFALLLTVANIIEFMYFRQTNFNPSVASAGSWISLRTQSVANSVYVTP